MKVKTKTEAFTLIELLVVTAIVAGRRELSMADVDGFS